MKKLLLDQENLECFLKEAKYPIGKSTILKYVSEGLITAPKRFNNPGSLTAARVYYNPLAVIETMTIIKMTIGYYTDNEPMSHIAKFTLEDIFWARLYFYSKDETHVFPVKDFESTIKFSKKEAKNNISFDMANDTLKYLLQSDTTVFDDDTKKYITKRWNLYKKRIPDENIRNKYLDCVASIYANIFTILENEYANKLQVYSYAE